MAQIPPIITDPTDCDVYKWSMGNFLYKQGFIREVVGWGFFNRHGIRFPLGYGEALKEQIDSWNNLRFDDGMLSYFEKSLYWLDYYFIWAYLKTYKFDTSCINVRITVKDGYEDIEVNYEGEWGQVIFFEIFLLSTMTELYGIMVDNGNILSPKEQEKRNLSKILPIAESGAKISEFGTRRRYSKAVQELVLRQMKDEAPSMLAGTSNAMFARKYNLTPIGTLGHELVMFMGAKYGPRMADKMLMQKWVEVYRGALGIYLPDTYTTKHFLQSFDLFNSKLWDGVREDSSPDTDAFVDMIIDHYKKLKINPATKTIVHSNAINNIESILHMQNYRKNEIQRSFGIGTWFTNDVYREPDGTPMDWVVKMTHMYDEAGRKRYCVKVSDIPGKITSADDPTTRSYLEDLGLL